MSNIKLSKEEEQLLDAVEGGEFESVLTDDRRTVLVAVAANTFKKDKRINIRIYRRDLLTVQSKVAYFCQPWPPNFA
jgi:predicted DNA binding CopG/RHH family protein